MPRYRAIFDAKGLKAEFEGDELVFARPDAFSEPKISELARPMVIRDIAPYQNMIDGRVISSRSEHRELLRRHNCVEVGNERMDSRPPPPKTRRREALSRQLGDMSDRQANKLIKSLKKELQP